MEIDPSFAALPAFSMLVILIAGVAVSAGAVVLACGICYTAQCVGAWLRRLRGRYL